MRRFALFVSCVCLVPLAACNDTPSPTQPSTSPPVPITEPLFSGTLTPNGATTYPFGVQTGGRITATLKALAPDDAVIGLSLGTWNGATCQAILSNDRARQGAVVIGDASGLGNFCVRVFDATGALTASTSYDLEVVHP